jgi:nucleoid-associated protein YgaU
LIIPDQEHLLKAAEPDRLELRPATPALKSTTPTTVEVAAPPSMREYTVRSGDTLSELAQKLMGSARNTSQLLKINKDRIESADALRVGTRLRYPMAMATGTP